MDINITNELVSYLWLTLVMGAASPYTDYLLKELETAENARSCLIEGSLPHNLKLGAKCKSRISEITDNDCIKVIDRCRKHNINIVTRTDPRYPSALWETFDPPPVLYYKGDISEINSRPAFSIVGTRDPSLYSIRCAQAVAGTLAEYKTAIVSGFAVGIDIASHLAAVKAGSRTYAILGCGIDHDYPKANSGFRRLIEENGAFISEYPPGTAPSPYSFPPRNRIIAGLSYATAVIEAGSTSGALITANYCTDQGKPVYVIPPADLFDGRYGGNAALIRDGALTLIDPQDIIYDFYGKYKNILSAGSTEAPKDKIFLKPDEYSTPVPVKKKAAPKKAGAAKAAAKRAAAPKPAAAKAPSADISALDGNKKLIAEFIAKCGRPVIADEAAEGTGLNTDEVLSLLLDLELEGVLSCGAGGTYTIL